MTYQSFDGPADSDSQGKLAALRLPQLEGRSFLDLGCNEGFFCGYALKEGARRVVGIDSEEGVIGKARQRFPEADFRCGSWLELPDERFDVILLASALHYEKNPLDLCRRIRAHLAPGGVFVLECGVVTDWVSPAWVEVQRWDCAPKYPTQALLQHYILQDFAVRHVGPSVVAPGDPVARHVFHCQAYSPAVLVVRGPTGAGKTVLSSELGRHGLPVVDVDQITLAIARNTTRHAGGVFDFIRAGYHGHLVASLYREICQHEAHALQMAEHVCGFLPEYARACVLEGAILDDVAFFELVRQLATARGFRVWELSRGAVESTAIDLGVASTAPSRILGNVDGVLEAGVDGSTETLVGWCMRPESPRACGVIVDIDGVRFGPFLADRFRPDLKAAGLGHGAHAFEIKLGALPHSDDSVVAVLSDDAGERLTGADCTVGDLKARCRQG
jgi:SAM-dependent methyltransferase